MKLHSIIAILTLGCALHGTRATAASVGPAGYTNDFSARPAAADFATLNGITGASGDIGSAAAMDVYVQNVAASGINAQVTDSSPTNPPLRLASAQWTSGGSAYLVTRPTGNRATVLLARLVNNTGTNCNTLGFGYQFTVGASLTEQVPGQRLAYSFSAASNAWITLPAVSGINVSRTITTNVLLAQTWTNGGTLHLMWLDDNSTDSTESAYEIDNFFAAAYFTEQPLSITLTSPAHGQHFTSGAAIVASAAIQGSPTNVSYYVDGALAVERTTSPFSPVTLPTQEFGAHTIYAVARDTNGILVTTITNTFDVEAGLSGTLASNTTLYASNSPYTVSGNLVVPGGVTLAIQPGVTVQLRDNCGITVQGRLLADGNTNQPITFTRYPGDPDWDRIKFVAAADSRLRYCVIEYASCAGDHQDYYPTVCNPPQYAPRSYHEAIVALACHLDLEGCVFRNLLGGAGGNEGDALAIISDDAQFPGAASANILACRFDGIGQGVHTRFSYVRVENCYFVNKHGDNDDVDLYGESTPPPLILNNMFAAPCHEDRINPTRCSAVIIGNVIAVSDDHGIVLRDRGFPVLINNVLYNCANGAISVQNTCDALILNNTIVNSGRAFRFFDHFDRHVPPYCLTPGSGRATIKNCIVWNCAQSMLLTDSTNGHSYAEVSYCDIQGGQGSASVSANSTLVWGPGNLNVDPQFIHITNNQRLTASSPCIDAGTNLSGVVSNDFDVVPRPLDGNGSGGSSYDIGAFEFLLASADSNNDGIPDGWCQSYGLSPVAPGMANEDPDHDFQSNLLEYQAGTDPTNAASYPVFPVPVGISSVDRGGTIGWSNASPAGVMSVLTATNILGPWVPRENYFTTNPLGQANLSSDSETLFYRLLAVDLSTNTPRHYTNLLESYGVLETVAGLGQANNDSSMWLPSYEGAWATNVQLSRPHISFGDSRSNVLIVDQRSSSVLKVTPDGRLFTYAGTHTAGDNGDGPSYATNLHLNNPNGGWLGTNDVLYVLDTDNAKVRRISPDGIMTTLFTTGFPLGDGRALWVKSDESVAYFGSGATATNIYKWTRASGVIVSVRSDFLELGNIVGDERTGDLYVSDRGANRLYRLSTNNVLTAIAGNGTTTGGGEGFPALQTGLIAPRCVALLPNGGYFTCEHSPGNRIWYIDPAGIIHRWMNGSDSNNRRVGDGLWFYANPDTAKVSRVRSVIPDPFGNLIITESNYGYVRRIRFQRMNP